MAHLPDSSSRRALKVAAPVFAGLMLLGACSKKDDTPSATTSGTSASSSSSGSGTTSTTAKTNDTKPKTSGSTPGTAVDANMVKVDTTVWFLGFKISLPNGVINDAEQTLTFTDATIENLSDDTATLYGDYSIEAGGTSAYSGGWQNSPSILAKSKAKDTLVFRIDEKFKPKESTLVMGPGSSQQVRIALDGSGKVTSLQPVDQATVSPITMGELTFTPKNVVVRYDRPAQHDQAEKDTAYLVITGDLKNNSTGALYVGNDNASLASPDDTKANAINTLGAGSVDPTQTDSKFGFVFQIKAPYAGDYTLDLKGNWGADNAEATATAKITLVAAGKSSGTTTGTATTGTGKTAG